MASGMWGRLSTTAGAFKNQVGRMAEDVLNSAEEFSQQVGLGWQPGTHTPDSVTGCDVLF